MENSTEKLICPKCGKQIPGNATLCPSCGTRVKEKETLEKSPKQQVK